ncbi:beta strand repeat-containing protein [Thioalkalivibrio sp. HK1]|uniref:beta strand repeat-containing protein n=1 Tax=Thioalkalivibrio sp. HK1 TaxID=1469245 RepID=UPI0004BAB8C3|nr:hypothetical protein [Thioalkalivibrio sp. HK1]
MSVDVTDDDSEAFVLPSSNVSVNEGSSNTFNIKLATLPSADVTVTLAQPTNTDVTVGSTSLTFTTSNWDQNQSVTVNAGQDADTADESASISVSASGGGYGSVTGSVGVDVTDDDTESFVLPSSDVIVNEGSNNTFSIRLATLPSASVTVTLAQPSNTDVTVSSTSLTFTTSTWNVNQTVTVNAAQDADTADESASISVSASGGGYGSVTGSVGVDVTDDDTESFILPSSNVSVNEGSNSTFNIKLATLPSASVTVTLAQPSNGDVKVDTNTSMSGNQNTLTFTTSNWDQNQSVRVNAAQDNDLVDDSASISVSASGGGYGSVTGTVGVDVTDDDTGTIILPSSDLAIDEGANSNFNVKLSNQPSANVTVTLTQPSNGDVKVDTNTSTSGNQTTLTFTSGNWNVDQSVRVTVSDDDDLVDESASISISASGGGFAGVSGSVGVDITDVDVAEFILPTSDLSVDENDSTTFNMKLSNQPSANVTVTLAQPSGSDVTVDTDTSTNGIQNTLTFTSSNWNQNQTVTVNAANDFDAWDDTDQTISVSATGGGFAATTGSVVVDVTDDDTEGLNLPSSDLSVEEGESTTFMVSLATLPRADITVTLAQPTGAGVVTVDTDTTASGNQNTLTFTPSNWNASQTVTVSAGHDDDAWDHADVTISVSASGGNYGSVTGTVKVDVTDDDEEGLTLSASTLSIDEGDDETLDVRLTTTPMGDVTVTLNQPGNSDIRVDIEPDTFGNQNTLTFTNMNWNVSQTARVYAEQDADAVDESASISLTVSSSADSAYAAVTDSVDVDVTDDEEPALLILAIKAMVDEVDRPVSNLAITESATATFEVKLATEPGGGNVTVTLTQPTNTDVKVDTDTSASGYQNTLTFTTGNWNTRQRVAVTVLEDDDAVDESASIAITASGADYGSQTGSVGVMVTDNDEVGLTLSASSLTIAEGGNQTFDVELATLPSGTVTVNLSDDVANADVTYTPSSLTFTGSEWDTAQTVTVSVAHDPDASDESARIALVASGGDYGGVRERVSVDVEDDDEPALVLTPEQMSITEGTNDTFDVKLATLPSANVSVTLTQPGNNDVKIDTDPNASGNQVATLLFTGSNWNTNQRVTINTSDDDDLVNDSASIALSASGGDYVNVGKSVSVTVTDNDTAGLTVSPTTFNLAEGGNGTFTVRLTQQPNANVSMTLAQPSNTDVTVDKTSLTFTSTDWDVVQTVRIRAAEDDDAWDDSASDISISTTGGGYDGVSESVSVAVTDNDEEALILPPNALEVTEGLSGSFSVRLATLPSASVTVTLTQPSNADVKVDTDPDTTGDQNTLTFTVSDWDSLKTVTVNVAEDDDGTDENASIALSASGGGYNSVSSTVNANVTDNDTLRVIADPGVLNFTEGESGTFDVRLGTLPSGNVTVMLRQQESNADLTMDKSSLTFTPSTWHERQTVTVNAAQDDDTALDESIVLLSATGADYGDVSQTMTIRVTDNDSPGLTVSPGEFELVEGTGTHFLVRLAKRPNDEDETVMVTLTSSSPEVMIDKTSLTFTTGTWNTGQVVALEVAHDDDDRNESAVIDYTAAGGEYDSVAGSLVVEVVDDDEPLAPPPGIRGLILVEPQILEIDEGTSKTIALKFDGIVPTSDMTLVLARSNKDISFEPSSLRFTPLDWNEEQYITVSAANDSDGVDDTDIITFAALGIEVPLARMTVAVRDDEYTPPSGGARGSIVATPRTLMLGESLSRTIAIRLQGGVPDREVIVSLRKTNDDITLSPFSLIFTPSNWFEEQIVTVSAAFDTDGTDDTDIITMVATGGGYDRAMRVLPITVIDTPGMLEASPETIELEEGGSAKSFTVGLGVEPIGTEAVIVSLSSSNPGIGFSPSSLVFTSNDWDRGKSVSARAAEGSNRQGGLDVITVDATGGNYAGVQSTISVKYIEDEVRIGRPTPSDPLRTHALGIPPAVSGDQSTLSISCRQERPCAVLLDCTAQSDGAVFQGEIPGVIPGWGRLTLTARDIESYTGGSWSGKGRLGCALRSVGRITSQVWTRSGDGVLVNNSAYIRSYPEGDGHRADIESITSPDGFEKSNIRIRCMAPQGERCTSMRFDCYEDHGKHRRSEPFEIGSSIVRHMQSEELASMIDYRWRGMGMACELRSDAPFTVQVLTRTGGGGALVNNSGGGNVRVGD